MVSAAGCEVLMRVALAILVLLFASNASAAVHRVPSEFGTIQAGIDACAEGDTVLVAPGTYTGVGNRDLSFHGTNLVLRSEAGSAATVIDCQAEGRGFIFESGESGASRLEGFTVRDAFAYYQGAGLLCLGASPTLEEMVFADGLVGGGSGEGGGAYFANSSSQLEHVAFTANRAWGIDLPGYLTSAQGGGVYALDSALRFADARFIANRVSANPGWESGSHAEGAGIAIKGGVVHIDRALFAGNGVPGAYDADAGGGVYIQAGAVLITSSTFVGNGAMREAAVSAWEAGHAQLRFSIVAGNQSYMGPSVPSTVLSLCSAFWGNIGVAEPHVGLNGCFAADPLFCDAAAGDYTLDHDSPCLPANNGCGLLIGALGQGCGPVPVDLTSFTATPAAGAVDLAWEADALADFRLTGTREAASWDVAWQSEGSGLYRARDESPQLAPGGEVSYRLEGRLSGEDWQLLRELAVTLPPAFATRLLAPHPNPFNPTVTLPFTLAAPGRVRLEIFDLAGRRIATLADGHFEAGEQALAWDGRDGAGNPQASGVYFARLAAAGLTETKRLVLLR
jgi:hypothetical protein